MACVHDASKTIVKYEGREIRVANASGLALAEGVTDCLIDLARLTSPPSQFILPGSDPRFLPLEKHLPREKSVRPPILLRLGWPDMAPPPVGVGLSFWRELWELLPVGITVIACEGGHGRSGTALAAMLIARGMDPEEAIEYVRRMHCSYAIETAEQEAYLRSLR